MTNFLVELRDKVVWAEGKHDFFNGDNVYVYLEGITIEIGWDRGFEGDFDDFVSYLSKIFLLEFICREKCMETVALHGDQAYLRGKRGLISMTNAVCDGQLSTQGDTTCGPEIIATRMLSTT